jgi:hypothetical protein
MPDEDLDIALRHLQDSLSDLATLNNIVLSLRENTRRLLEPLKTVLQEARDRIDHTLTLLP